MRILMPLPSEDFDPTEAAVPWRVLNNAGIEVVFATPDGNPAKPDERLLSGAGFGPLRPFLRAAPRARRLYEEMSKTSAFRNPIAYSKIDLTDFQGALLPGGHAPGMETYLESELLQHRIGKMVEEQRPIAAICHGVVVLARAFRPGSETSVLRGRRVTALTQSMELSAWALTCLWLSDYYRTYEQTVEAEVRRAVGPEGDFETGPFSVLRDGPEHLERGFTVRDGPILTARWPGDAHRFATDALELFRS